MFSFMKKYAESISGIDVYPNVALAIFLVVFAGMIWFALKADKQYIHELEQIPFKDSETL